MLKKGEEYSKQETGEKVKLVNHYYKLDFELVLELGAKTSLADLTNIF